MFARRFHRRAVIIAATFVLVVLAGGLMFLRARRAIAVTQVPQLPARQPESIRMPPRWGPAASTALRMPCCQS